MSSLVCTKCNTEIESIVEQRLGKCTDCDRVFCKRCRELELYSEFVEKEERFVKKCGYCETSDNEIIVLDSEW